MSRKFLVPTTIGVAIAMAITVSGCDVGYQSVKPFTQLVKTSSEEIFIEIYKFKE